VPSSEEKSEVQVREVGSQGVESGQQELLVTPRTAEGPRSVIEGRNSHSEHPAGEGAGRGSDDQIRPSRVPSEVPFQGGQDAGVVRLTDESTSSEHQSDLLHVRPLPIGGAKTPFLQGRVDSEGDCQLLFVALRI
jgi:hypothetical protein